MSQLKRLLEILRAIKRPSHPSIRLCPRCGSRRIHLSSKFDLWLTPPQYVCEKCGYKGPIVLEVEVEGAEEKEPPASREVQGSNAF